MEKLPFTEQAIQASIDINGGVIHRDEVMLDMWTLVHQCTSIVADADDSGRRTMHIIGTRVYEDPLRVPGHWQLDVHS